MAIWQRNSSTGWTSVHTPHINVDNVWREASGAWVRSGGVWVPVWERSDNQAIFTSSPVGDGFRYLTAGGWTHKGRVVSNIAFNAYTPGFDGVSSFAQLSLSGELDVDFIRYVVFYPQATDTGFFYTYIKDNLAGFSVSGGASHWSWVFTGAFWAPPSAGVPARVVING